MPCHFTKPIHLAIAPEPTDDLKSQLQPPKMGWLSRLKAHAETKPEEVAIMDSVASVTYGGLLSRASRLAGALHAQLAGSLGGEVVGVMLDRCASDAYNCAQQQPVAPMTDTKIPNMCTHVCSRVLWTWLHPFWQSFVTPNQALITCVRTAHLDHSASVSAPVYLSSVHNQISSNRRSRDSAFDSGLNPPTDHMILELSCSHGCIGFLAPSCQV